MWPSTFAPSSLSKLTKDKLATRDVLGRNILHLVILWNRSDWLRHLLKNPEIKSIISKTDYESGWNCLHYIIFFKRLACYKVLLDYLKTANPGTNSLLLVNNSLLFDLIRCKDRARTTPLQLLDNDFKNMMWFPDHITEQDEILFSQRFLQEDPQVGKEGKETSDHTRKLRSLKDRHNWWDPKRLGSDIYMFGSNLNNNLGVGDSTDRHIPSKLMNSTFCEEDSQDYLDQPRFKAVKLSKNHSVILTKDGSLYSCGIGSRGRLGHGIDNMNNSYRFKKIEFFVGQTEKKIVKDFSISTDHTLAVTTSNEVFAWGLNSYGQIGYKSINNSNTNTSKEFSEPFEAEPRLVYGGDLKKNSLNIRGTAASKIHSLVYTKFDIFFWGLNIGQMGFPQDAKDSLDHKVYGSTFKGSIQHQPRCITLRDEIKFVQTCEACTCVVTSNNELHLYFQNQHVKLPRVQSRGSLDKNFHIFCPAKLSKPAVIVKVCMKSHENIALLLDSGDVVGFSVDVNSNLAKMSKSLRYSSLWKSHDRDLRVTDCDTSVDGSIALTTASGLVFMKDSNNRTRKNSMSETALPIPIKNKFRRIDYVNKITRVSCDENFASFGFIRDDIDQIPLKIQANTYMKDIEYLSILNEPNLYRKQNQLFSSENGSISYITDYIYPVYDEDEYESEDEDCTEVQDTKLKMDVLFNRYSNKFDATNNKRVRTRFTYEQIAESDMVSKKQYLKISPISLFIEQFSENIQQEDKNYDAIISFEDHPDMGIGFHQRIFRVRSPFFKKLLQVSEDQVFVKGNISGQFSGNRLIFNSGINVKAALILVHFIYTNRVISIWDDYPTGIHCPSDIKEIKHHFENLGRLFEVFDLFGNLTKDERFLKDMRSLYEVDQEDGDLTVILADGQVKCSSFILTSRSAFFETTLASRWNPGLNFLEFDKVSKCQFNLVLKHMYGFSDYSVFNDLRQKCDNKNEFIGALLEIIQIADELLLFQLKNLCQVAIKDLISLENVVVLLTYSNDLKAKKLFINCCWYIFNNLEIILLDPTFLAIPNEVLVKLENEIDLFDTDQGEHLRTTTGTEVVTSANRAISNQLVSEFIYNQKEFNKHFMSDARGFSSFEPLIDVKMDIKTDQPKRQRKSSRKSSSHQELRDELAEIRKAALTQVQQHGNESAIDVEDDFEVVKSSRKKSNGNIKKTVDFSLNSARSISPPSTLNSVPSSGNSSTSDLTRASSVSTSVRKPVHAPSSRIQNNNHEALFPVLGKQAPTPKPVPKPSEQTSFATGLSPHSKWASKSNGSSILKPLHMNKAAASCSFQSVNSVSLEPDWLTKKQKPKMAPSVKLSQKERKKLAIQTFDEPVGTPVQQTFSWGSEGSTSSFVQPAKDTRSFPTLGKAKRRSKSPSPKASPSPRAGTDVSQEANVSIESDSGSLSLIDIMLEESLKIEEARQNELQRKSLQEIQQEQEFARWWEEEAKRVQMQMQNISIKPQKNSKKKTRKVSN
ncbi:hypothetical protein PSN45_002769 [Yamadazyma tenuis]|uniref:uncharacterized protein n=1 Tax=Candida tenuis TaxID=2315449 RepID=UPI00279D12A1|nr:hypothetical protein PSN45_002769 [Yamadazyma tenuis]